MIKNFTPNDLVSFLYNETSAEENSEIKEALAQDAVLNQEFEYLKEAKMQLPKVQFSPSANAIQNILKYSRESSKTLV